MEWDKLWMTATDRKRLYIIRQILEKSITQKKAGELLRLSTRQIKRICKSVRREGDSGVIHKSINKPSNRGIEKAIKAKVLLLSSQKYRNFGPGLLSEQLSKREGITISDETLRKWLQGAGLPYKKRRERPHRHWRQRKEHFGELLQMDGSHHDWLEGRGPRLVLMGFIDDATGCAFARFFEYEGTLPAFDGLKRYFQRYGIPCSIYLDKHSTYRGLKKVSAIDQLEGDEGESEFQRAMKQLSIDVIHANSPQAKGRIERFFRTLQDRLVKEMRLENICSLESANNYLGHYLVEHNKKYCVSAAKSGNLHRPVNKELFLDSILSIQTRRFVRNDFTVFYKARIYQLKDHVRSRYIRVEERINGSIHLMNGKKSLNFSEIAQSDYTGNRKGKEPGPGKGNYQRIPKKSDHPWKGFRFGSQEPRRMKGDISTLAKR